MRLAIDLSRENVLRETGGPFGALILETRSSTPVAVGVNMVVSQNNCVLHAEIVAIMMAQAQLSSFSLRAKGTGAYELITSCEPCAMCIGAILWSGVKRVVCGATREDAERLHFDEGPVFPQSYMYLRNKGIEIVKGVCRDEARSILELYRERGGIIYSG